MLKDQYSFILKNFGLKSLFNTILGITYGRTTEYPMVEDQIKKVYKNGLELLDIGCEGTFFPVYLADKLKEIRISGCDLRDTNSTQEMIEKAGIKNIKLFPRTNFIDMPGKFDVITSISTFEHIPNYNEYLENISKIKNNLKSGGIFILTMPFTADKNPIEIFSCNKNYLTEAGILKNNNQEKVFSARYLTQAQIDETIKTSGLKLVSLDFVGEKGLQFSQLLHNEKIPFKVRTFLFYPWNWLWDKMFISKGKISDFPIMKNYRPINFFILVLKNDQ